jgi:peptide/nickel transport system permease protein
MLGYFLKRIFGALLAILGAASIVFFLIRLSGDPARLMAPPEATNTQIQSLRTDMGLNEPLFIQYFHYLGGIFKGNLGDSLYFNQPALKIIVERLPATIELGLAAIVIATVLGVIIGLICAVKRNSWFDNLMNIVVLIGQSLPVFWLGIILILIFSVHFHLFPTSGKTSGSSFILPALTLAAYPIATITRMMRSSLLDVLNEDYIRTARAKGFTKWAIVFKQALKNAFIPVLTVIGLELGSLLGGAVVTESVFAWPGIGQLVIQSVYNRDFPLVQASVLVISFMYILINFAVDLCYFALDPRIVNNEQE